jgi:hypothetical protein
MLCWSAKWLRRVTKTGKEGSEKQKPGAKASGFFVYINKMPVEATR